MTVASAILVVSATLVAEIVAVVAEVTLGAVNNPLPEMVPPLADQVTLVFDGVGDRGDELLRPRGKTLVETGEIATVTVPIGFTVTTE